MKKVTCTLPNVSGKINGVDFDLADGVATAVLEDDVAAQFDGIPGYELTDEEGGKKPAATKAPKKAKEPEVPAADGEQQPAADTNTPPADGAPKE